MSERKLDWMRYLDNLLTDISRNFLEVLIPVLLFIFCLSFIFSCERYMQEDLKVKALCQKELGLVKETK